MFEVEVFDLPAKISMEFSCVNDLTHDLVNRTIELRFLDVVGGFGYAQPPITGYAQSSTTGYAQPPTTGFASVLLVFISHIWIYLFLVSCLLVLISESSTAHPFYHIVVYNSNTRLDNSSQQSTVR